MKRSVGLCIFLSLAAAAHAAVGELKPVPVQPGQALGQRMVVAQGRAFSKRIEGDGTVNPHAMVAELRSGESGFKAAVDAKSPEAKAPDVLRIDLTGTGKFDGRHVAPLAGNTDSGMFRGRVGPATIHARIAGITIPVTISGSYYKSRTYRSLALILAAAAEGDCRFGAKTRRVRIVDGNNNLRMGDAATKIERGGKAVDIMAGDTLVIDQGDGTFRKKVLRTYLGSPVLLDGVWYEVTVTGDGTKVAAKPLAIKTGRIRIPHEEWSATFIGEKFFLIVKGGKEPAALPADRYIITGYQESLRLDDGKMATLSRSGRREAYAGQAKVFDVPAGKTTELAVGSPLTAGLTISRTGGLLSAGSVRIDLELKDTSGAAIGGLSVPGSPGGRPPCPTVRMFDAKGSPVYNCKLEYG